MSMAIDKLTPEQLDRYIHMQSIVERQQAAAEKTRALRAYYGGEHPIMLTDRQREFLGPLVGKRQNVNDPATYTADFTFAHNLLGAVVDTLSERLSVTGFTVNGASMDDEENGEQARALWDWWKRARMDLIEQELYVAALRDGKGYLIVDPATGDPRCVRHDLDDGKTGIMLHRDPEDASHVLYATRYFWTFDPLRPGQTGIERKTVYLPGEVRKYQRRGMGQWVAVMDDGDPSWPLPWADAAGPLGVAVTEFANPGGAEIERVIGLQNALNKSWLDLIAAADMTGFQIYASEYSDPNYMPVAESDAGIEGRDEMVIAPGRMIEIGGGTFKAIPPADLTPLLDVIGNLTTAIAGVSRTPQYLLRPVGGSDVPSGEALKQTESGLVARAVKRQRVWGQAWEDVLRLVIRVAAAYGPGLGVDADAQIEVQWADPNTRNELSTAQTAQIHKALGVPDVQIWQMLEYTPAQIEKFQAAANAAKAAQVAGIAAALRTQQPAQPNAQNSSAQAAQ